MRDVTKLSKEDLVEGAMHLGLPDEYIGRQYRAELLRRLAAPSVSVETSAGQRESQIDKEFESMATDEVYQRESLELLGEGAANTKSAGRLLGSSVATPSPEAAPLSGEGPQVKVVHLSAEEFERHANDPANLQCDVSGEGGERKDPVCPKCKSDNLGEIKQKDNAGYGNNSYIDCMDCKAEFWLVEMEDAAKFFPAVAAQGQKDETGLTADELVDRINWMRIHGSSLALRSVRLEVCEEVLRVLRVGGSPARSVEGQLENAAKEIVFQIGVMDREMSYESVLAILRSALPGSLPTQMEESCGTAQSAPISTSEAIHPIATTAEPFEAHHLPSHEWNSLSQESREKISKWFDLSCKYLQAILDEPEPGSLPPQPENNWPPCKECHKPHNPLANCGSLPSPAPQTCDRCNECSDAALEHLAVIENADLEEGQSAVFELRKLLPTLDKFIKWEVEDASTVQPGVKIFTKGMNSNTASAVSREGNMTKPIDDLKFRDGSTYGERRAEIRQAEQDLSRESGPSLPSEETRATDDYEYSQEINNIYERCEANVNTFSNDDVSTLFCEINRLANSGAASPAEGPTPLLIKCTNCDGYVMFKRVSPSEIEIIHNCEGDWYEEVSALLARAGIPEREAGVEPGSEVFISLERRVQMLIDRAAEIRIEFCDSPCGHSSQYAYSEDGGKNIICLVCELKAAGPKPGPLCPKCGSERLTLHFGSDLVGWLGTISCAKCGLGKNEPYDLETWDDVWAFFTPSAGEPQP